MIFLSKVNSLNSKSRFLVLYIGLVLQLVMNENSRVIIGIEYERDGIRRASYGEIDRNKFDELHLGRESLICLTNDGVLAWIDKESILSVYELETKLRVYEKHVMGASTFATKKELGIRS